MLTHIRIYRSFTVDLAILAIDIVVGKVSHQPAACSGILSNDVVHDWIDAFVQQSAMSDKHTHYTSTKVICLSVNVDAAASPETKMHALNHRR